LAPFLQGHVKGEYRIRFVLSARLSIMVVVKSSSVLQNSSYNPSWCRSDDAVDLGVGLVDICSKGRTVRVLLSCWKARFVSTKP
jgi:hypothetical protein